MNSEYIYENGSLKNDHNNFPINGINEIDPYYNPSHGRPEKINDELDSFSATISIIEDAQNEKYFKKSFLLLSKSNTQYHHYSYKSGSFQRHPRLNGPYPVLPQIKGHNLAHSEGRVPNYSFIHNKMSNEINTMRDLTNSILRYGGNTDVVWMKFANSKNGQKLVRPGFSARRYMANLVKNLSDNMVEKMISEGKILEKTLFKNSILLPHIRRRISADLSRYPEPYRILKQMLISPGPLNDYSFIWKNPDFVSREASSDNILDVLKGGIKVLSKKTDSESHEVYEEVQYAKMSHDEKKTVLSNLLLKSAMNHTLKMKDEIVEYNLAKSKTRPADAVQNIHIPVIKFDMKEAITDLLNKETMDTLTSNFAPSQPSVGFKGQALRKTIPKVEKQEDKIAHDDHFNLPSDDNSKLNLLVNPANITKVNYKLKSPKDNIDRLPDFTSVKESPSSVLIDNLKNRISVSIPHKEMIYPYGKYRDDEPLVDESRSRDTDKPISEDKTENENVTESKDHQNRLITLLTEHAKTVAENVLRSSGGGEDLASDVNDAVIQWNEILTERYFQLISYVAITEILKQDETFKDQANTIQGQNWNFQFEHMKNQEKYGDMIKNIFKSIFKDRLNDVANDAISISDEVMVLLQNGSKLTLDNLELCTDPLTGHVIINLQRDGYDSHSRADGSIGDLVNYPIIAQEREDIGSHSSGLQTRRQIGSSFSPLNTESDMNGQSFSVDIRRSLSFLGEEKDELDLSHSLHQSVRNGNVEYNEKRERFQSQFDQSQDTYHPIKNSEGGSQNSPLRSKIETPRGTEKRNGVVSADDPLEEIQEEITFKSPDSEGGISIIDKTDKANVPDKKPTKGESLKQSKEFVVGHVDNTKELKKLYSQDSGDTNKPKGKSTSQKPIGKQPGKKKQMTNKKQKQEVSPAPSKPAPKAQVDEIKESAPITNEEVDNTENVVIELNEEHHSPQIDGRVTPVLKTPPIIEAGKEDIQEFDQISDDGDSGDDEEEKERKRLMRLERNAKRNLDAEKRRLDVQRKRKEKEEQRKLEIKKRELEEELTKKLEEERRQKEEEWRLKREKEKADELQRMDEMKREEYLRQKQIEKERRDKEEYNRKLEEMKLRLTLENQRKKEEQDRLAFEEAERLRIENEMISRMKEAERIEYLQKRAEEEERKRREEEEERLFKEEQARIAFEEARRIAQQQAKERAIIEARLNFIRGLRIENEGLKKYLNVTPSFVWSYFEFLKILGIEPESAPNSIDADLLNLIL